MRRFVLLALVGAVWPSLALAADPAKAVDDGLKAMKAVGPEGAGNEEAAKGWKAVVAAGEAALVPTLTAFDDASPLAVNWLRSAVNAIAEQEAKAGRPVSADDLGGFAANTSRNPAARRLAFELMAKADKNAAAHLLPNFLNDPDRDLRRDAITSELKAADALANPKSKKEATEKLFTLARDQDQVEEIAKKLKDLGVSVNTTKHYGFITEWNVSEAFDNKELKGFAVPYPPEKATDRTGWKYAQSWDAYGAVDLNTVVADSKDVLAYAVATVVAPEETKCQVRLATPNAVKLFVNGKEVYFKEEYHSGKKHDQHVANVTLKKGANELLVKVCQNDKTQSWMKPWEFAARVCDATGGALPVQQQISKDGKQVTVALGELAPAPKKEEKK